MEIDWLLTDKPVLVLALGSLQKKLLKTTTCAATHDKNPDANCRSLGGIPGLRFAHANDLIGRGNAGDPAAVRS